MQKIFQEYGGVITTAMAIVALVGLIGMLFTPGGTGWMDNAFKDVINGFGDKVENAVPGTGDSDNDLVLEAPDGKVPEGYIYTSAASGLTFTAGETLPSPAAGDTLTHEDSDYIYSLMKDGFSALEEARTYWKNAIENDTGMTWDEVVADAGMSEEDLWEALGYDLGIGLTEATFVPAVADPYWMVSVKDKTKTAYANDIYSELVDIPVTTMDGTFFECTNLVDASNIVIPSSITNTYAVFARCTALTKMPDMSNISTIGEVAFQLCTSLTTITISDSITTIGEDAFGYCEKLTSITIPDSVTTIGEEAFARCTSLTDVTISDSVTSIGKWAFAGCTNLTNITFEGTMAQWNAITFSSDLNADVPATEVVCSDGTVSLA